MGEHAQIGEAPPGVTLYQEHIRELIGVRTAPAADPARSVMGVALHSAILSACDGLQAASEEYAAASANLAEATVDLHVRRMQLVYAEEMETLRLIEVIPGEDAEERKAHLAVGLWEACEVVDARTARDEAVARHLRAEHQFRVVDQAVKALRARLDALTAVLKAA